jgi:NAD(P)-dependent dehydrogenase (short-subunit alcohol dehydrogenase family)
MPGLDGRWPEAELPRPGSQAGGFWRALRAVLPRSRFRFWTWICAGVFVVAVIAAGAAGFAQASGGALGLHHIYQAIQLFGLNFPDDVAPDEVNLLIQIARFAAPLVLIAALIKLMADGFGEHLRLMWHVRFAGGRRDIVLGFGPVGRAVGAKLLARGRKVTWIARVEGSDEALRQARDDAEELRGFLLIADPSSQAAFKAARARHAERVFVTLETDCAALDAGEALRVWLGPAPSPGPQPQDPPQKDWLADCLVWLFGHVPRPAPPAPPQIRVLTESPEIHALLPQAARTGFVSGHGVSVFNLRQEAVRRLVLEQRWDRTALLLGQERVHLVLAGCGWQGEALFDEVLLFCHRADLAPPLVTVLDINARAIEARIRARSPALFDPDFKANLPGWEPPRFVTCDLEAVDLSGRVLRLPGRRPVEVTAWAVCTGSDELNLRVALKIQTAMQRCQLDGAPVYARVWSDSAGGTLRLGLDGLSQTNVFGSLAEGLAQTSALDEDPDAIARLLHQAYLAAEAGDLTLNDNRPRQPPSAADADAAWIDLIASKQASNRRAHRHAPCKLDDLGFDWPMRGFSLPQFATGQVARFDAAEADLRGRGYCAPPDRHSDAGRFQAAMVCEHDRWMIDRAIDGWRRGARDDTRQLNPNMVSWDGLSGLGDEKKVRTIRAYDGVLLQALLRAPESPGRPSAREHRRLWIRLDDGAAAQASAPVADWADVTEAVVQLPLGNLKTYSGHLETYRPTPLWAAVAAVRRLAESSRFCRLVLDFRTPTTLPVLDLANELARLCCRAGREVHCLWSWRGGQSGSGRHLAGAPAGLRHGLAASGGIVFDLPADEPSIGFTGHRDLDTGTGHARQALLEVFKPLLALPPGARPRLWLGHADGADRLAAEVWTEGGGKVGYLFPYPDPDPEFAWTDDPSTSSAPALAQQSGGGAASARVCLASLRADETPVEVIGPLPPGTGGHTELARILIDRAALLIAAWDGIGPRFHGDKPGGTADTVARAKQAGKPVVVVPVARRKAAGRFRWLPRARPG